MLFECSVLDAGESPWIPACTDLSDGEHLDIMPRDDPALACNCNSGSYRRLLVQQPEDRRPVCSSSSSEDLTESESESSVLV